MRHNPVDIADVQTEVCEEVAYEQMNFRPCHPVDTGSIHREEVILRLRRGVSRPSSLPQTAKLGQLRSLWPRQHAPSHDLTRLLVWRRFQDCGGGTVAEERGALRLIHVACDTADLGGYHQHSSIRTGGDQGGRVVEGDGARRAQRSE